jgi:putative OPT family oligopeptide transporter
MNPSMPAATPPVEGPSSGLPENAYRELKPGETYTPMVPASVDAPELTPRSILFGIAMNVLWAAAATYVALKVGQGIETAIPISILAVGLSGLLLKLGSRRSTILENINILAISTTSGMVAGGTVFTMPAIYLLGLPGSLALGKSTVFLHIFLVPLFGAALGVIFLVPFRRYFVKEMHGKLPFPEATATNEILVTGQGGGSGAVTLIISTVAAAAYTFASVGLKLFSEVFSTGKIDPPRGEEVPAFAGQLWAELTDRYKAVFSMGTGAEFVGLGFIIGVKYASIILAGSVLSSLVLVPLLGPLDLTALQALNPTIKATKASDIFRAIPRNIGIGCIFTAGILSILKMSPVIVTALKEALGSLLRKSDGRAAAHDRTDRDIGYPALILLGLVTTAAMAIYFRTMVLGGMENANLLTAVSVLLAVGVAFIFITVSAWAIATISVTPISGMTVTTIIVTAMLLQSAGLPRGPGGQLAVLLIGGVVATALSVAGTLVTEFKIGYWAGSSPRRIEWSCLAACALASAVVTATIMLLADSPGFDPQKNPAALQAPQANLMRSTLESFLGTGQVPWIPYAVGVMAALMLQLIGVSPLAFGLGMYMPMALNAPIFFGALVASALKKGARDEATAQARSTKGTIIASGFIAGAALMGVALNGLRSLAPTEALIRKLDVPALLVESPGADPAAIARALNWLGLAAFIALCLSLYAGARRARRTA